MAGTDTIRGIAYQQAHAIHLAIDLVDQYPDHQLRVEGMDDVVDIEILDGRGKLVAAHQVKSRTGSQWTPKPVRDVMRRWAALDVPNAEFTFVTNKELGPGAQKIHDSLADDSTDRQARVGKELGIEKATAERLNRARIRVDPSSVGALLTSAERRLAGMLDPLERDTEKVASQRVDTLFSVLTQRASHSDPDQRLLTAAELRELVGGARGERPEFQWAGGLRAKFMDAVAQDTPRLVPLTLDRQGSTAPVQLGSLIDGRAVSLSGATGTGKSSIVQMLQASAAAEGRAVISCRAETYVPGHLDALIADALGFAVGAPVPTYAGRQVLADPEAVIIIDGVSEIPDATSAQLARELSSVLTRPGLAAVVLVGRDPTVLRRVLAPARAVDTFTVTPLGESAQDRVVEKVMGAAVTPAARSQLLQRAAKALRDGVRNPMLLTIYLEAAADAAIDLSRAEVYERFVSRLSERAPSIDAGAYAPVLGAVFAQLLTAQRRYSDRYEWVRLTDEVAASFRSPVDGARIREAALQIGLITEMGVTGIIAPFHDSIADYLAGAAVAAGVADLPPVLRDTQSEWVLFASELGVDVSDRVTRDLPFLSVRAAETDHRTLDSGSFDHRVALLLDTLVGSSGSTVTTTEAPDGRWVMCVTDAHGAALGKTAIDAGHGPLYAAVRVWRLILRARVSGVRPSLSRRPASTEDARTLVRRFVRQSQTEISTLLDTLPPAQRSRLLEQLRPLGLSFYIGVPKDVWGSLEWSMTYFASVETRLLVEEPGERAGRTVVSRFLDGGPARSAASDLAEAIEQLVDRKGWLA